MIGISVLQALPMQCFRPCLYQVSITYSYFATKGCVDAKNRSFGPTDLLRNENVVFEIFFIIIFENNTCPLKAYGGKRKG